MELSITNRCSIHLRYGVAFSNLLWYFSLLRSLLRTPIALSLHTSFFRGFPVVAASRARVA